MRKRNGIALTRSKGASGSPLGPKNVVFGPHPEASPPMAPAASESPVSSGAVRRAGGRLIATLAALTLFVACESLLGGGGDGSTDDNKKTLKVADVYAATLALVGSSQLPSALLADPAGDIPTAEEAAQKAHDALGKTADKCVKSSVKGAVLTVDFGTGCQPPNSPIAISGKVEATYTVKAGPPKSLEVSLKLTNFGAGDKTATGTGKLTATPDADGADVTVQVDMTAGDAVLKGGIKSDIHVDKTSKTFTKIVFSTTDPTEVTVGESKLNVVATDVTFAAGDCYPSTGSVVCSTAGVKSTFAFDANTAKTGTAKLTKPFLKTPTDQALPGIGWKCK